MVLPPSERCYFLFPLSRANPGVQRNQVASARMAGRRMASGSNTRAVWQARAVNLKVLADSTCWYFGNCQREWRRSRRLRCRCSYDGVMAYAVIAIVECVLMRAFWQRQRVIGHAAHFCYVAL